MSANVEITDTFDQWRTKSNEWLSMTHTVGSDNFIKLNNTTNSTSNTTGSIVSAGGIGIAQSAVVGGNLTIFGDTDIDGTTNLDAVDIDGAVQIDGTVTVGVDDTGHDVKFFGASAGAFMLYDESEDTLEIRGASGDATTSTGKLLLSTALTDINDGDVIGRIDFQAPVEAGGTDAIVVGATILAEADATFSGSVNSTDLVFLTGDSGAATEKLRIDSTGQVTFADGAIDVNIASHDGTNGLKLGGSLVTASAAELNYNDITSLGTAENSKVVTSDAQGNVSFVNGSNDINISSHDGGTNGLKLGGTLVTKTATDINSGASSAEATAVADSMAIALG